MTASSVLTGVLLKGTFAARPAANAVAGGALYSATDTNVIYQSDGASWATYATVGSGAPTDATYITQTANGSLSAEQALSSLSTGLVKVTTGTGVLSTASASDLPSHDHTGTSDGGKLTNDAHDGYSIYEEIAAPSAPAVDTLRLYAKDNGGGTTELYYKNSGGTERDLSAAGSGLSDQGTATYLDFAEAAAPATPAANKVRLYAKADGSLYQKDDAGLETGLAGGGGGAPDSADYWVETANASLSAEIVVGTTGITTAAYGARQAAAKAGRIFLPNDGFYVERDTGSAWAPWGPIFPLTAPVSGDFAWINQGSAAIDTTYGGVYLSTPSEAANLRIRKKAAPSAPYTITVGFLAAFLAANYGGCGLLFRQSSDGKVANFGLRWDNLLTIHSHKWSDASTFSAPYDGDNIPSQGFWWLRIADDNTNRICSFSADGQHWIEYHTVGRTDFLTADEVGFYVNSNGGSAIGMTVLSWKQA